MEDKSVTAEARVQPQVGGCGICDEQIGTGARFSLGTSASACQ